MTSFLKWRPIAFIWDVWTRAAAQHLGLIAAGVAFFCVFALFPALAAVISLFGLWADPQLVMQQVQLLEDVIPLGAFELISGQINALVTTHTRTLGWTTVFSAGVALWSTRAGVGALIEGLNAIQGTRPRGGILHIFAALSLTAALIVIALIGLFALVVVPIAMAFMHLPTQWAWVLAGVRWGVALAAALAALGLLYRYGPRVEEGRRISWLSAGALLVVTLWSAMSALFTLYVGNFSNYNEVYGSIGAVIALMMWLYISAYLVLLGAAVNYHLAETAASERV